MGTQRQLTATDGFVFEAYEARPAEESRGALVVIQEIFGVNAHIREVCDQYAVEGYVTYAPQLFDRIRPGIELGYSDGDVQTGIELARDQLPREQALLDLQATITEAAQWGRVGVVGYCLGGLMAWRCGCDLDGVACVASYYGGGIIAELDRTPRCPMMLHFGDLDSYIPRTDVDKIAATHPEIVVHRYSADHGFNCDHRSSYDASAADLAGARTLELFRMHIG